MDQKLAQEVGTQINAYYKAMVATLLDPNNYAQRPKIKAVKAYLTFVEAALKQPYGRIVHIHSFFDLSNQLLIDRMYPFCYFLDTAKEKIKRLRYQSEWLLDGLESYDLKASEAIGIEPHELLESC